MLFEPTPAFQTWFEETNRALAPSQTGSRVKPTAEAIEAGLFDFKAIVEETQQKCKPVTNRAKRWAAVLELGKTASASRTEPGEATISAEFSPVL